MTNRVLLLTPSRGLGGGIERYSDTLEWAFNAQGVECRRIDLVGSGPAAHARMLVQARRRLRGGEVPTRVVVTHRALLPVASVLARGCGISLVCHGIDVWGAHFRLRRLAEACLMRRPHVRVAAASSFTAGALPDNCAATVLPPGLSQVWFDTLVDAARAAEERRSTLHLVTAFRLAEWRNKGLPQLLDAVADLGRSDVSVSVCGSGNPSPELLRLVQGHDRCIIKTQLTDYELANELAGADIFVLATRTRHGRRPSGEGFGLVLLEAQVAGTPVIGPAFGGSHDAFIDRVTGIAPTDETVGALTKALDELLKDPSELVRMGQRAAAWARECFAPERYASRVVAKLL